MSAEHDALRLALGGYVLGTLPSAEMERVRIHLAECAECRAEHTRLAGLPALLATVTEAEVSGQTVPTADGDLADRLVARAAESAQGSLPERPAAPAVSKAPAGGVLERLLQQAAARRRRTWRLQLAGAAASLMFVAAAAGGTWLAAIGSVGSQATPPGPTAPIAWRTFSGSDPTTGVSASVKVSPSAWGSVLQVSAKGAPAGITCRLQAVGPGGARTDGATWRAGEYPPGTTIPGAVAMSPGAIDHFEILAGNGQKLVTIRA
ncbi:zf-HC2 domain-containing protein [Streptomyces sp. NBC_00841]|uniref:zf-HC2 domain-containing protein n=1 Tax=Streptomyces sp. NBC_00841 TaxID=2975847 RepID=UPI002DDC3448|nr:zf-HC2 domain-containing protein [Streptomyces sp. NBC_00841]WSA03394.1 zf-HC2 domain-containing protein [Streptomyces sp. NBC_00841]